MARIGCDFCKLDVCTKQPPQCAQVALGLACHRGLVERVREAVVNGKANVNAEVYTLKGKMGGSCTAVYLAAQGRWPKVLKVLLEEGEGVLVGGEEEDVLAEGKIYKYGDKCYTFSPNAQHCDQNKQIVKF